MQTIGWIDATEKTGNKTPTKLKNPLYKIHIPIKVQVFLRWVDIE